MKLQITFAAAALAMLLASPLQTHAAGVDTSTQYYAPGQATAPAQSAAPAARATIVRTARPVAEPAGPKVDFNDIARFIAGMQPENGGTLAALAKAPEWTAFSTSMDYRWGRFEARRLSLIRPWAAKELAKMRSDTLFYPFSGPDFIYAQTFFPNSSTYILCGLEPVGSFPTVEKVQPLAQTLGWVEASMKTLFDAGYFVTKDMGIELKASPLQGTLPLLCVMLERSGDRITSVQQQANSVRIGFNSASGGHRTLWYFSADLSNGGMGKGGAFSNFIRQAHPDAAYVKSASYLMHEEEFSAVRNFLLNQCSTIVQDDSGIPLRDFDQHRWTLHYYGAYARPLDIFAKYYQPDLAGLYARIHAEPIPFGAGYSWDYRAANFLVATAHGPEKQTETAATSSRKPR
jgi:hypothetical protein